MNKKTIRDLNFLNKRVFLRVDFNVPLDSNKNISDTRRIDSTLATIKYIIESGASLIIASHLGRPKGQINPEFSLKPIYNYLSNVLPFNIKFAESAIGEKTTQLKKTLKAGEILLLENVRFFEEETLNDEEFSKKLIEDCDYFVNDAFGTSHRAHASTSGVSKFVKESVAGFLVEKELDYLMKSIENPVQPLTAIIGGAKISGKIDVIKQLFTKVDNILIGGGMVFTFLKAMGLEIGKSLVEIDKVQLAKELIEESKSNNVRLVLPVDILCGESFSNETMVKLKKITDLSEYDMGLDIGTESIELFSKIISDSKTIIWNGPMGAFELKLFEKGTKEIAKALAEATKNGAITVIGGGDSAAAVSQFGLDESMSHISTGGGASLELLEGKILPGISVLTEKN